MRALEGKFKELRDEQCSYDNTFICLNKMWNQLIDDLVLLDVRAGGDLNSLQVLDHEEMSGESLESCPSEEIFLFRLLNSRNFRNNDDSSLSKLVEEALALPYSTTVTLMKSMQEAFAVQQARSESLSLALNGQNFSEDVIVALENHNNYLKVVVDNLRQAVSIINGKHEKYLDEIEAFKNNQSRELHEIKCLSGKQALSWIIEATAIMANALANGGKPLPPPSLGVAASAAPCGCSAPLEKLDPMAKPSRPSDLMAASSWPANPVV